MKEFVSTGKYGELIAELDQDKQLRFWYINPNSVEHFSIHKDDLDSVMTTLKELVDSYFEK